MIKLHKIIENVTAFFITEKELIAYSKGSNRIVLYDQNLNQKISFLIETDSPQSFFKYHETNYFWNGNSDLFKINGQEIISFHSLKVSQTQITDDFKHILSYEKTGGVNSKQIQNYDLKTNRLLWKTNLNFRYSISKMGFLFADKGENFKWNSLVELDPRKGEILWNFNHDSQFVRFLGLNSQNLIVKFEDEIICFDPKSKEIRWKDKLCQLFDEKMNMCFYLGENYFKNSNATTGAIINEKSFQTNSFHNTRQFPILFKHKLIGNFKNELIVVDLKSRNHSKLRIDGKPDIYLGAEKFMTSNSKYFFALRSNNELEIYK